MPINYYPEAYTSKFLKFSCEYTLLEYISQDWVVLIAILCRHLPQKWVNYHCKGRQLLTIAFGKWWEGVWPVYVGKFVGVIVPWKCETQNLGNRKTGKYYWAFLYWIFHGKIIYLFPQFKKCTLRQYWRPWPLYTGGKFCLGSRILKKAKKDESLSMIKRTIWYKKTCLTWFGSYI